MKTKLFYISRLETFVTYSGEVVRLNPYKEFKYFIENTPNTIFTQHYKLFKNQTGVYRFNINDQPFYIGYSENLENRVKKSFFNHCLLIDDITFQYILCDNKWDAIQVEAYYISILKPTKNKTGINDIINPTIEIPQFCKPIRVFFNEFRQAISECGPKAMQ